MRDKIFALLGVEPGEESMVTVLLIQSVFLGIFFGTFDISAHSLFLSIFDEKMMARAYVVSGFAGIILTSLYTWLQSKLSFKNFSIANLFAVTLFTLVLWTGLLFARSGLIVFLVFIMLGPLNILAALGFWGTAGRLFTLRQGKRLFGLVDSGLIVGIIISCYAIPVVLSFNFSSHNILLISAFAVLLASFVQLRVCAKFNPGSQEKKTAPAGEKSSVLKTLKQNRYITIMAIFVALSVMAAFFVQYSFMAVTRQQYPSEEEMARFLGIFTGSMMIFTLLIKLLAFSYLIRNYGLKISLTISPILISFLVIAAILIGLIMGYTPAESSGFLIFFLILALGRLFSKSLKDSLESPSFKVIYQTLDEKIRFEVQSAMDGTVNEIAALSSGLILAGLGMLSSIKLIHFSLALFVIIILWIIAAFLLYSEYRKSIRKALETTSPGIQPLIAEGVKLKSRYSSGLTFRQDYYRLASGDMTTLDGIQSKWYLENLINQTADKKDVNLIPALLRISANQMIDEEIRKRSGKIIQEVTDSGAKVSQARRLLAGNTAPQQAEVLRLLRDNSADSKRFGIYVIGKFKITEMISEVCTCLANPLLRMDAIEVLTSLGKQAVNDLQRYSMSVSGNDSASSAILRILGKIPCEESLSFLFSKLWSRSRYIRETAIKGLIQNNFLPSPEDKDRLHQLISDIMSLMTWNLSARVCLKKSNDDFLLQVLERDMSRWRKFLFDLLSVGYDHTSIDKIKENLDKDTVESGNFALEMIDIVIDESIKPKMIALLDLVPDEVRLKNLWHFYPGEIPSYEKLVEDLINRDYNNLSIWTKASTLHNIKEINGINLAESVSALLFTPETILQEEAARLMARSDREIYRSVSGRIPDIFRKKIDGIMSGQNEDRQFLYEKVLFLSGSFPDIPEDELLILAEKVLYIKDFKTGATCAPECIVWNLNDGAGNVLVNHENEAEKLPGGSYYILPLSSVEDYSRHFPESTGKILTYIDLNEVNN